MLNMYNMPLVETPGMLKLERLYKVLTGEEVYILIRGDSGSASNIFMRHIETTLLTDDNSDLTDAPGICITRTSFGRNDIRHAKEMITVHVGQYPAMKINTPLSAALTPKMGLTTVWYDDTTKTHHAITTQSGVPYHVLLALLMLKLVDNEDFTRRATAAIMSGEELQYTPGEQQLLDLLHKQEQLEAMVKAAEKLVTPMNYEQEITTLQNTIASYEARIADALDQLQKRQSDQFYANVLNDKKDTILDDTRDYLMGTNNILYLDATNTTVTVVNEAYLHIPETASDFFKPEALQNPSHIMHEYPMIAEVLKHVMLGILRIPIRASYTLSFQRANDPRSVRIYGDVGSPKVDTYLQWDRSMVNLHVTRYECFAGYKSQMISRLADQDVIGMFEVMNQCTSSISVFDNQVMNAIKVKMKRMSMDIPVKYKENDEWHDTTIGGYYEKIKVDQRRAAEPDSGNDIQSNIINEVTDNQLHVTDATEDATPRF